MTEYPSGTVTFLFTDIEGSTQLWEQHPEAMKSVLAKHDAILKDAIESNHGTIIKTTGDGIHAVFETAIEAVNTTLSAQRYLQSLSSSPKLKVRMGLHTGEAELRAGDYYGQALNRGARIMSAGHGGQILLSFVTADLAREHLPADISLLDLGEHRLKDLIYPENIFQLLAPDLPKEFPALKSLNTLPNNLPFQLTSFIGREREIKEANQIFANTRLLTFIGPGGTGKTRLSLQVAVEQLTEFKDGVWLIELASITDPSLILQAITSVFNLRMQLGMPLQEILLDYLRAKNLLLILDNCEHLVEACAQLVDQILRSSPQIKFIVSSREALGISGETVYRVPSLSLPNPAEVTREALEGYESVQLFVERAQAANPKFQLTDSNASSVAQICFRLDGIPLALELAAARIAIFAAEQIATRLDDRFKLLTGGSRTALPRQQTLRALIDWSYDMLSEDERALLRRLSVFVGGWTFEAAEAVCGDLDVLELLIQLVNKSLVIVDEEVEETRYHLLETIRQYARNKLLEAGEAEQIRNAHMKYFVNFSELTSPYMDTKEVLNWIPKLDAEYDNLNAAFEWGLDHDVEACLRIVGSLAYYWFRRGHGAEGIEMSNAAFARANMLPEVKNEEVQRQQMLIRAKALQAAAFLSFSQGDNPNAYKAGSECIVLARQLDDIQMLAVALSFSASAKLFEGDIEIARAQIEEAIAICQNTGEKFGLAMAYGMKAQMEMMVNHDLNAAEAYEQKALEMTDEIAATWTGLMMYFATARGAIYRRDYAIARERLMYCLPFFIEMKDEHRVNMVNSEFAHMDRYEGKFHEAEERYRKTIRIWQKLGHRAAVAHQLECIAFLAKVHEEPERALHLLGAAEILREKIKIQMQPPEREEYESEVADLRASVTEQEFTRLWAQGRALTMEQAIQLALNS
jgi:predicted ATPase/class 3 adenylate cyclase